MDLPLSDEFIHRIVFATLGARRFTQDSPVQPDVWERFIKLALVRRQRWADTPQPGEPRVSLILTPKLNLGASGDMPAQAAMLAERLRLSVMGLASGARPQSEALPADAPEPMRAARQLEVSEARRLNSMRIAASERYVVADLTLAEVAEHVLPLTEWWQKRNTEALDRLDMLRFKALLGFTGLLIERPEIGAEALLDLAGRLAAAPDARDDSFDAELGIAPGPRDSPLPRQDNIPAEILAAYERLVRRLDARSREPLAARAEMGDAVSMPIRALIWRIGRNRPATRQAAKPKRAAAPAEPQPAQDMQSAVTVKADAARRLFAISTKDLVWAVVDTGIDAHHPAFLTDPKDPASTRVLTRLDFTRLRGLMAEQPPNLAATDQARLQKSLASIRVRNTNGRPVDWSLIVPLLTVETRNAKLPPPVPSDPHGTHVAGILAGDWPKGPSDGSGGEGFIGVCPDLRLYDIKVFPDEPGEGGDDFAIIAAIEFLGWLNRDREIPVVHGVNLSLSIRHHVDVHACGSTPICEACDRLVNNGTIVVAAAGNAGFSSAAGPSSMGDGYRAVSITDPGNAEAVITVGATHRSEPHKYGVSYFSSRGPTGDGRAKPDLVAPGEKILSAAPGGKVRIEDGTSMAAPHVSGVCALVLARHRELIGKPRRVKELLMSTATDLGRERHFQGCGLVDALRALQGV